MRRYPYQCLRAVLGLPDTDAEVIHVPESQLYGIIGLVSKGMVALMVGKRSEDGPGAYYSVHYTAESTLSL